MTHPDKSPLVSILIPLFNEEKLIGKTIESCLQQTYKNLEVIIVDDHSTDQSFEIAKKYESHCVHVFSNPSKGACSARNYAFSKSEGEYVKFHDADDYCSPNLIECQMTRLLNDGDESTIVYSPLRICVPPDSTEIDKHHVSDDYSPSMEYVIALWRIYGINWHSLLYLFPRSIVEKSGGWNNNYPIYEDAEFIINALKHSSKIIFAGGGYGVWRMIHDKKHLHAIEKPDVQKREADGLFHIAEEILAYKDTAETRQICSRFISNHIYHHINKFRKIAKDIEDKFNQYQLSHVKYKNPKFSLIYNIFGWWTTTYCIHQMKSLYNFISTY